MNKLLTEFIGTFFLVLVIGLAVIEPGAGSLAPLVIGATLMAMVYAGGHKSGAHYNPAVTLAVWLRGKHQTADLIPYMIAQIVAAIIAAIVVLYFKDAAAIIAAAPNPVTAVLAEFLFTFALAYVVLNVATADGTAGNSFYGLAIGSIVMVGAFTVGGVSGGAFNPAVAVGISVMGLSAWSNFWIFLVGNLIGGVVAAVVFKITAVESRAP